jgi:MoaA/NifB/PqqE/SkfB family radical SAM enzyme
MADRGTRIRMSKFQAKINLAKALLSNPRILKAGPRMDLFLLTYLRKFKIKNIGGKLVIHSHLPPLNSPAYARFIDEHLLAKTNGPSHAQIGVTNLCPQNCAYCYNKNRTGRLLDTDNILQLIQNLKKLGVFWIGFTGGEPLLNKDLVKIVENVGDSCASKLFTTGCTLTRQLAIDLKMAGLFSVSISLDSQNEKEHDSIRGYSGAFRTALKAIEIFKSISGLHVSVSSVLSRNMINNHEVESFLDYLANLGVDEAWLSETKPSIDAYWNRDFVITEEERLALVSIQDKYNKWDRMTVNYLGHFEGREHFGCNAGRKMIFIDPFGEVSPCVFTPFSFGNITEASIDSIYTEMTNCFPSEGDCFINKNYPLFQKYYKGQYPIPRTDSLQLMKEVAFRSPSKFYQIYNCPKT